MNLCKDASQDLLFLTVHDIVCCSINSLFCSSDFHFVLICMMILVLYIDRYVVDDEFVIIFLPETKKISLINQLIGNQKTFSITIDSTRIYNVCRPKKRTIFNVKDPSFWR